jgi:hypothetical protein
MTRDSHRKAKKSPKAACPQNRLDACSGLLTTAMSTCRMSCFDCSSFSRSSDPVTVRGASGVAKRLCLSTIPQYPGIPDTIEAAGFWEDSLLPGYMYPGPVFSVRVADVCDTLDADVNR